MLIIYAVYNYVYILKVSHAISWDSIHVSDVKPATVRIMSAGKVSNMIKTKHFLVLNVDMKHHKPRTSACLVRVYYY